MLFSVLEGELEARDLVIDALKVFINTQNERDCVYGSRNDSVVVKPRVVCWCLHGTLQMLITVDRCNGSLFLWIDLLNPLLLLNLRLFVQNPAKMACDGENVVASSRQWFQV